MMDEIGGFESFDLQGKLLKIEKTEESLERGREAFQSLFPEPEIKPIVSIPPFLPPQTEIIRGPVELAASPRPVNMAIPSSPAPEGFEHLVEKAIATPPAYPPPSIDEPPSSTPHRIAKELPQSNAFWEDFDMPDEPPPHRNFEESEEAALVPLRKKRSAGKPTRPTEKKEKFDSQQELLAAVRPVEKKKTDAENEREAKPLSLPHPLPAPFVLIAEKASIAGASSLNPVTETLFRELVGSIAFVQKTSPGVNRTEIVLNGEALNKSPFYNATIVIEQHATAPGSFNITLQGSPQAVQIFQTNLPSLASAFETAYDNKEIPFRVTRLEASLSSRWSGNPKRQQSDEELEE